MGNSVVSGPNWCTAPQDLYQGRRQTALGMAHSHGGSRTGAKPEKRSRPDRLHLTHSYAYDSVGERVTSGLPLVAVVDDDESMRESLPDLLRELGYSAKAFASAEEFLAFDEIAQTQCLVLDISMPGMSGPELHRNLIDRGYQIPVIFITALSGPRLPPILQEEGVVACLTKPFSEQDLRQALIAAIR